MAKTKYDPQQYDDLTRQLQQAVLNTPQLTLSPGLHQINFLPPVPVIFIAHDFMSRFNALATVDCRTIKLINLNQPAIACHFFTRHKYQIQKKLTDDRIKAILAPLINDLCQQLVNTPTSELNDHYEQVQAIYQHPQHFRAALSNYHRHYTYPYVSYRYQTPTGLDSANTHLIQKQNVIFIDTDRIQKPRPDRDDKAVEIFLAQFSHQVNLGKTDFFFTPRESKG